MSELRLRQIVRPFLSYPASGNGATFCRVLLTEWDALSCRRFSAAQSFVVLRPVPGPYVTNTLCYWSVRRQVLLKQFETNFVSVESNKKILGASGSQKKKKKRRDILEE